MDSLKCGCPGPRPGAIERNPPRGRCLSDGRFANAPGRVWGLVLGLLFLVFPAAWLGAADWSSKVVDKEPPKELDESFRTILEPKAVQLSKGGTVAYEFWFVREVALKQKPESMAQSLDAVAQTTPLGAVVIPSERRDYRDKELFAGVYTARLGLQPQDGDHLGTADYTYFLVLIPAQADRRPSGIADYKSLVKASGKDAPSGHPVILSLRPVASVAGPLPAITEPAPDHTAVRIQLAGKAAGNDATIPVAVDVVCEGQAKH